MARDGYGDDGGGGGDGDGHDVPTPYRVHSTISHYPHLVLLPRGRVEAYNTVSRIKGRVYEPRYRSRAFQGCKSRL